MTDDEALEYLLAYRRYCELEETFRETRLNLMWSTVEDKTRSVLRAEHALSNVIEQKRRLREKLAYQWHSEGLPLREIADRLKCSVVTIRRDIGIIARRPRKTERKLYKLDELQ